MIAKRIFDIATVILTLPLWLPLILIVALLVRIKLGSPIFFQQVRPGLHGKPFKLTKFRSLTDQRNAQGELLPDDQRMTAFGRKLRASSLDELPEFWNILKGEMSLVGPRPLLMEYLPLYSDRQKRRHQVPPGLTGWAQIHGRNNLDWPERLELDVWYAENRSLTLDLKILLKTLTTVFSRKGVQGEDAATMKPFRGN
jgi:lipopolysaccharide/colanic/teichoic acid biosynthesis glycosyltransferase